MELKNHFIHLFKYNDWATRETANSMKGLEKKDEHLSELLSHIISAQKIWLNRILMREIILNLWGKHSIEENVLQSTAITAEWINFLESLKEEDFEKHIEYKNTKGEKAVSTINDIIIQVINHSTYHRAQIAQRVRALGGKPAITDYIVYQRTLRS